MHTQTSKWNKLGHLMDGPLGAIAVFLMIGALMLALMGVSSGKASAAPVPAQVSTSCQFSRYGGCVHSPYMMSDRNSRHLNSCLGAGAFGAIRGAWWGFGAGFGSCSWSWVVLGDN